MREEIIQYFRCPEDAVQFKVPERLPANAGYFRFGQDLVCYGRSAAGHLARSADGALYDAYANVHANGAGLELPFDPAEVVRNLRYETYANGSSSAGKKLLKQAIRGAYYLARPLMPVAVRKHFQKAHLNGWQSLPFPHWPVDTTVDTLLERLLALCIRYKGGADVPFVWFWPGGMSACAIVTHDVEEQAGVDLCSKLMDLNDEFGIPASFQVVPEKRYRVTEEYLNSLRTRGFEVNVHDLNHDGRLYQDRKEFERRAAKINQYGRQFKAVGFRAGVLYRNQDWFDLLDFEYDTSVPNVAHLDPQRGGCCTVMPYFIGKLVELPVTITQDYSLFHIVNTRSLDLWQQQTSMIVARHGLVNVIVHPDYINGPQEEEAYRGLLRIYDRMRREQNVWIALPKDVNAWWRQRNQMKLVQCEGQWRIEGPGAERAMVAFARLENDRLSYRFASQSARN